MFYNSAFQSLATPQQLTNYAEVLVNAGLGHGQGIKAGEVVLVGFTPESSVLIPYIQTSVTKAGGHLIQAPAIPYPAVNNPTLAAATHGTTEQIAYFPTAATEALYNQAQHYIKLKSAAHNEPDCNLNNPLYRDRQVAEQTADEIASDYKENHWQSYTLAYVPSEALAEQSHVSLETIWKEIVKACHLDSSAAVANMRETISQAGAMEEALNALQIRSLHVTGENVNLHVELTAEARFRCSRGGNIPSFECFVTPHAEKTSGWIAFDYPLLYAGNSIAGLRVEFTAGEVTDWSATTGQEAFAGLLSIPGMTRLGEFALTDKRLSQIDTVIPGAPVLLENIGGTAHVAFGRGYKKCFADSTNTPHCNQSAEHRDVVLSGEFTVTATTATGEEVVIFAAGMCPLI